MRGLLYSTFVEASNSEPVMIREEDILPILCRKSLNQFFEKIHVYFLQIDIGNYDKRMIIYHIYI